MSNKELTLLKKFENSTLYQIETGKKTTGTEIHLVPHFDGGKNMAIGYGLDLYVNSWATIKNYLEAANKITAFQFDFKRTYQVSSEVSYTFQTIVEKYQSEFNALSDEEKGVLRIVLGEMKRIANYKDFEKISAKIVYSDKEYNSKENPEIYQKIKTFCTNTITPLVSFPLPSGLLGLNR